MAIRIGTRKFMKGNTLFRRITKISGVAEKEQLPPEYLQLKLHVFAIPSGIKIHNNGYNGALDIGDELSEGHFTSAIAIIKRAGNNLYRINKGLPVDEDWKGRETIVI